MVYEEGADESMELNLWSLPSLTTLNWTAPVDRDHPVLNESYLSSLQTLSLRRFLLPDSIHLPHLTNLSLYDVIFSGDTTVDFFKKLQHLRYLTLSLEVGLPFDYIISCSELVSLKIIFNLDQLFSDENQHYKIKVSAPIIHQFTSVGFGRFTFEVGDPEIVSLELEDTSDSYDIALDEDNNGRTVVSDFLLGIAGAKVLMLDKNSIEVLRDLSDFLPSPPFYRLEYVKVPEAYGGEASIPIQLKNYFSQCSQNISFGTKCPLLEEEHLPIKAFGWAAKDTSGILSPFDFSIRENGDDDVTIQIQYCGVCHFDLHAVTNAGGVSHYPVIPGNEIVGFVTKVGRNVQKFVVGDRVGVGFVMNSCKSCETCKQNLENYCPKMVVTYNGINYDGSKTYGGYSDLVVVDYRYVLRFPENLPLDSGAPLLGAGITVYSPMKYYGMTEPGKHLGVAGLGGLGHVAVKLGKAFGLKITVISSSPLKESDAISKFGADAFIVRSDREKLKAAVGTMDFIIETIDVDHSLSLLLPLLKMNGKLITVGLPDKSLELPIFPLVLERRLVEGSNFGVIKETQELLDFCAQNNITSEIELIHMDYINTAMKRLARSDVRYRFVIDIAKSFAK